MPLRSRPAHRGNDRDPKGWVSKPWLSLPDDAGYEAGDQEGIMTDELFTQIITPTTHDLGGFKVHRTLPSKPRTMVGPFIFFDQMGPARLTVGTGIDVRPHP